LAFHVLKGTPPSCGPDCGAITGGYGAMTQVT
jgi:hypothetical protein